MKAVDTDYKTLGELSVKLDDIERFRKLDPKAPGHSECRWTSGVETTTGRLGHGVAASGGMAIASKRMAAHLNQPGSEHQVAVVHEHVPVEVEEGGKLLAARIIPELESDIDPDLRCDSSTNALIPRYRAMR